MADEHARVLNRVLVILAHPDDPEFFCGATIARWARAGKQIRYCMLTCGDKGSDDPNMTHAQLCEVRHEEQTRAARMLGVSELVWLNFPDGELIPTLEARRRVAREIRKFKPDIVVTCDPNRIITAFGTINHPDHRAAGLIALDAIMPGAGNRMYFTELLAEGLEPHQVKEVYIAGAEYPDTFIDVTDTFDLKIRAIGEHKSQFKDFEALAQRLRARFKRDGLFIEMFRRLVLA
ncbi:MAG TPA: PIG-L deacetylase family protein [Anaerolineae bacterium]|nr:PIG-L deacetylase family protein [Anaerolineae bacterium]